MDVFSFGDIFSAVRCGISFNATRKLIQNPSDHFPCSFLDVFSLVAVFVVCFALFLFSFTFVYLSIFFCINTFNYALLKEDISSSEIVGSLFLYGIFHYIFPIFVLESASAVRQIVFPIQKYRFLIAQNTAKWRNV